MKLSSRYLLGLNPQQLARIRDAIENEMHYLTAWNLAQLGNYVEELQDAAKSRYLDAWKHCLDVQRDIQAEKDLKALLECKLNLCLPACEHLTREEIK